MLCVIIPVHNRRDTTCRCLESIYRTLPEDAKVLVVDDGSTDGTSGLVSERFPLATLISGDGSLWWSGSVNAGIRYALKSGATVALTLNDDTLVTPAFFSGMLEQHRANPRAILGALELDAATGQISHGGERMNWWTGDCQKLWRDAVPQPQTTLVPVTHLNGRGLLIPAAVFHEVGLFDEARLPQRAGDFDFTHRAARAGFPLYCNYRAPLLTYPLMDSGHQLRRVKNLKNYLTNLFSRRGDADLRTFTWYSIKNCPVLCLPTFMAIGYARRLFGYWLRPVDEVSQL